MLNRISILYVKYYTSTSYAIELLKRYVIYFAWVESPFGWSWKLRIAARAAAAVRLTAKLRLHRIQLNWSKCEGKSSRNSKCVCVCVCVAMHQATIDQRPTSILWIRMVNILMVAHNQSSVGHGRWKAVYNVRRLFTILNFVLDHCNFVLVIHHIHILALEDSIERHCRVMEKSSLSWEREKSRPDYIRDFQGNRVDWMMIQVRLLQLLRLKWDKSKI